MKTKETKIELDLYIMATPNRFCDADEPPFVYEACSIDCSNMSHMPDTILLYSEKTSVTLPAGINLIQKSVDTLQEQKEKLQAEYHVAKTVIEDKIANLLALEYKPEQEL